MKITNTPGIMRTGPARPTRKADSATSTGSVARPREIHDTVQVLSIPPEEMTERVQKAILGLMEEVDSLRRELDNTNRRLREMEDLADTDALLPVPNRRAFIRELNRMISFAERYGTPSTLMFIDLNDMKKINDSYGHDVGDKALFHVARLLSENIRGTDVIGRLGGDEFGILLAQADETIGAQKAQQLAGILDKNPMDHNGINIPMSLAFGTYTFGSGDQPDDAINKADQAMYENKRELKGEGNVR
ncbi:GGDEF domain-containing protein [Kordiimonas sp. SCSIO 12603]|uniref:GGDEF domain-containing protein n=1 Tax=Kordiimonas sp. SCSIO 12603 TaxID=2829596 RepID=UPI00210408A4|nr:GGDEF domain-containing protein [Kordiimonas sp. SCSIO 12603]UTW59715.1 GGDEF domain-containing protein [Kordiimonas sp. SCSIO 12603]